MIRVQNLTKRYGTNVAVDDLSFHVEEGEIFGFLGPNGAGKTTTMRVLTGYLAPTSGSAVVAGHDLFSDSLAARREIGYLPENVPLYEEMRVIEYLRFRARLKEVPRASLPARIGEATERLALQGVSRKLLGHLSKGYRQRVGIAACLLHRPKVLILDEPTLGLDPGQIRETRNFIRELGGDHTVLLSSHILPEVEAVCDKVIILAEGRLRALDTPPNLLREMESGASIQAEARGRADAIRKAIDGIGDVAEATVRPRGELVEITVRPEEGRDLREAVSRAIVEAGGVIREYRFVRPTLEDVFVRITTSEEGERT
jgi:ABC-2 type transport system ATP-binding protein